MVNKKQLDTTICCVYNEIMHKIFYYLNLYKGLTLDGDGNVQLVGGYLNLYKGLIPFISSDTSSWEDNYLNLYKGLIHIARISNDNITINYLNLYKGLILSMNSLITLRYCYLNLYKGLILFRANANLDRFSKTTLTYIRDWYEYAAATSSALFSTYLNLYKGLIPVVGVGKHQRLSLYLNLYKGLIRVSRSTIMSTLIDYLNLYKGLIPALEGSFRNARWLP